MQPGTFNNSSQQNQQQNDGFSSKGKFSSQDMPCSASSFALRNAASVSSANKSSTPAQAALKNDSTFREFVPSMKKVIPQDGNNSYVTTKLQGNENLKKTEAEKIVQGNFACEIDMDVGAAAENLTKSCQEVVKGIDGDDSKEEDIRVDKIYVYSRSMNKVDTKELDHLRQIMMLNSNKEAEGSLQHALLKKIEALPTPRTSFRPSTPDINLMNCRQACGSTNMWRLLPLIPPG